MATPKETTQANEPKKVKIRLPKENRGEENFVIVSVNCKNYKIMKGVEVEVPAEVAEVLANAEAALDDANGYMDKKADKDKE